jgi:hypothetical protein
VGYRLKENRMKRDEQIVEAELMGISTVPDDLVKLERIVAWCATHPDEVPFALSFLRTRLHMHRNSPSDAAEKPERL